MASGVGAQPNLNGEYFFLIIPDKYGYRLAYKNTTKEIGLWEHVPKGQSVKRWKEMVTQLHIKNPGAISAKKYARALVDMSSRKCAECEGHIEASRRYEGFQQVHYSSYIPITEGDLKPEWLIGVVMKGRDGIYLGIKAWRYQPSKEERDTWRALLERAYVCDTRRASKQCDLSKFGDEEIILLD